MCNAQNRLIFVVSIRHNKKNNKMRYLHFIIENKTENQIEGLYSTDGEPKLSLQCMAKIKGGKKFTYKIWDREENIVVKVK